MPYKKTVSLFIKIGKARESHQKVIRCQCCGVKVKVKNGNYRYCQKCCKQSRTS